MTKAVEELFTGLQADMIDICVKYADRKAETIYIYCSFEKNSLTSNVFYRINSILVKKHKLNDVMSGKTLYGIPPMQTEIKIVYDVVYSKAPNKSSMVICDECFDFVNKSFVGGE
jgi:hypothetical protein